jgi:Fe-Mn family superoxide dismutase
MAFQLPDLPYAFDALEPYIDARTMEIHHDKHHAGYTGKLNAAIAGTDWDSKGIIEILSNIDSVPEGIRTAVRNNGGGDVNHSLFWKMIAPGGASAPSGRLAADIDQAFGSFDAFKEAFASSDATEGLNAFVEKRPAKFEGK